MRKLLLLLALVTMGCVATSTLSRIPYEYVDHPASRRIELRYRNLKRFPVCLLPEFWPNEGGAIDQARGRVFLIVDGKRFSIKDINTGYCPGCAIRVESGQEVVSYIPYRFFDLPEELYDRRKELVFSPQGDRCSSHARPWWER